MPLRQYYEEDQNQNGGVMSMVKTIGQSRVLTSGWAGWAIKTYTIATAAATVFGMGGLILFHNTFGPVLPTMVCGGVGFSTALWHRWHNDRMEACCMVEKYPELMRFHVRMVEPTLSKQLDTPEGYDAWRKDIRRNWHKISIAIIASYSAADAFQRIREDEEESIVSKVKEDMAKLREAALQADLDTQCMN